MVTSAGRLPFRAIIHVAGINLLWVATEFSIRASVRSAMAKATQIGARSVAMPRIGAGTGGQRRERVLAWMLDELRRCPFAGEERLVCYAAPPLRSVRGTGTPP